MNGRVQRVRVRVRVQACVPVLMQNKHIEPIFRGLGGSHKLHLLLRECSMQTLISNRSQAIQRKLRKMK